MVMLWKGGRMSCGGTRRTETATRWGVAVRVRVMGLMGRMGVLFYSFAGGVETRAVGKEDVEVAVPEDFLRADARSS